MALIVVRSLLIPATFGDLGHYRAAAIPAIASLPIHYAGWQRCAECHEDEAAARNASFHKTLSCEICHGPALQHANDPDSMKPAIPRKRGEACLYCHNYLPSRPTGFPQIIEPTHNPMKPCISCHNPHDPTPPQGPGSCEACHAQIYRTKAVSSHARLECTTCHEAAPEHGQNPRAYPPRKPSDRKFCGQCHGAGAGGPAEIPRVDLDTHGGAYLCWQCHYPHDPEI